MNKYEEILETLEPGSERIQFIAAYEFIRYIENRGQMIADVGSGPGNQSLLFQELGFNVVCIDYVKPKHNKLVWLTPNHLEGAKFADEIWTHHCLEHIQDPISTLLLWRYALPETGKLYITVPQIDGNMSTGHINSYNIPLLMYHLAIVGFDCSDAMFMKRDSHLRGVVKVASDTKITKSLIELAELKRFSPDICDQIMTTGRFNDKELKLNWFKD